MQEGAEAPCVPHCGCDAAPQEGARCIRPGRTRGLPPGDPACRSPEAPQEGLQGKRGLPHPGGDYRSSRASRGGAQGEPRRRGGARQVLRDSGGPQEAVASLEATATQKKKREVSLYSSLGCKGTFQHFFYYYLINVVLRKRY